MIEYTPGRNNIIVIEIIFGHMSLKNMKLLLRARTGRDEKKGKNEEQMERGSRKRSSSAGSEKMERVGDG